MSRRLTAVLATAALAAGCATDPNAGNLDRARAAWLAHGPASYEITVQRYCFCASVDPVRIRVKHGLVVSRTVTTTGAPLAAELADLYPAVPGLFDLVEDAYRRAYKVGVTFNAEFGYPENTVIDYIGNAIDDELTVRAFGLDPIVGAASSRR